MSLNSISKKANIGNNVTVGDFTVIKDDVVIGDNVEIGANVLIDNGARLSANVKIHHGAVISSPPQDLKYRGEPSTAEIGEYTVIREYSTVNRGTAHSHKTIIGKNCFLMAYAHVAHDCRVADNVILANNGTLGGHVELGNNAIIGGLSGVHQFTKVGKFSLVGAYCRVVKDVPPFIIVGNEPLKFAGINLIGLRRNGFTPEKIKTISAVYDLLYKSKYNFGDAIKKIKDEFEMTEEVKTITDFVESSSRGIVKG